MSDDPYEQLNHDPHAAELIDRLGRELGIARRPAESPLSSRRFDELIAATLDHAAAPASTVPQPARKRRLSRRRLFGLGLAGAAGVTVAGGVTWGVVESLTAGPAVAATPRATPYPGPGSGRRFTLNELAVAAQRSNDTRGPVDHLVTERWDLNSLIDGQSVTSAVIPHRAELWRAPDDRARVIDTYLPPQFPNDANRKAWRDAGSPRGGTDDRPYAPGERDFNFPAAGGRPPRDPDRLAVWLARNRVGSDAILSGVTDLLLERALTGPERAALLRMLAAHTTLAYAGTTTDRAGRSGAAFILDSSDRNGDITHVFVLDPRTGRLLASEKVLTRGAPRLNVKRPAVISYATYLTAELVPKIP